MLITVFPHIIEPVILHNKKVASVTFDSISPTVTSHIPKADTLSTVSIEISGWISLGSSNIAPVFDEPSRLHGGDESPHIRGC